MKKGYFTSSLIVITGLFLILFRPQLTNAQIITTVAGNGQQGYTGDGGLDTSAELHTPCQVAIDSHGNLYIAEYYNHVVRKVSVSNTIITFAGIGLPGYSGDGGLATNARLNEPAGISFDRFDNLYIAEKGNNCIRKVTPSGIISTIAGMAMLPAGYSGDGDSARTAQLNEPCGVATDTNGNIYIADAANNRIRKINSSGIITTIAGMGGAGFGGDGGPASVAYLYGPHGVSTDKAGNIYIADLGNIRIRKILTNDTIYTIAGNGTYGSNGNGGPAKYAQLYSPDNVAIDTPGNVYIADNNNNCIRIVNTSGIINTYAGWGAEGYSGDGGLAQYAELNHPSGLAFNTTGDLFIADADNNRVRKVTPQTNVLVNPLRSKSPSSLICYPNPNKGRFTLTLLSPTRSEAIVHIYDISGLSLMELKTDANADTQVDLHLVGGIYFITTELNNSTLAEKIIVE